MGHNPFLLPLSDLNIKLLMRGITDAHKGNEMIVTLCPFIIKLMIQHRHKNTSTTINIRTWFFWLNFARSEGASRIN
jgi:hypothetical protein